MQAKTWEFQTWNKDRQLQSSITTYLLLQQVTHTYTIINALWLYMLSHKYFLMCPQSPIFNSDCSYLILSRTHRSEKHYSFWQLIYNTDTDLCQNLASHSLYKSISKITPTFASPIRYSRWTMCLLHHFATYTGLCSIDLAWMVIPDHVDSVSL